MRRNLLPCLFALLLIALPAFAAEDPSAGDSCSTAGERTMTGGPEDPDGDFLVCDGTLWRNFIDYKTNGYVGVKKTSPAAPLHVGGEAIIGTTTGLACSGTIVGAIRYNSVSNLHEFCNGTAWTKFIAETCDVLPASFEFTDQIDLGTSIQVSSNILPITGLGATCSVDVSVSGAGSPEYRVCSDASCASVFQNWTTSNNSIVMQGKYLQLRATTNASQGVTNTITATVGIGSDEWRITTIDSSVCNTSVIGSVCADGSVYAGTTADGSVPLYVTRCDAGHTHSGSCTYVGPQATFAWNDGNSNWVDTALANCTVTPCSTYGHAASAYLATADASTVVGLQNHAAAKYCDDLNIHGKTDWYLPSDQELSTLYTNRVAIGGFSTLTYTSVLEMTSSGMGRLDFNTGTWTVATTTKNSAYRVRCARRTSDSDPATFTFTDQTGTAIATSIESDILQITGIIGGTLVAISGDATAEYRICSTSNCSSVVQSWSAVAGIIANNQYLQVRLTSSGSLNTASTATATVGTGSDTWSVTTAAGDPCAGSPSAGTVCADGTVYAGTSPAGGAMYVMRCDAGQSWSGSACTGTRTTHRWGTSPLNSNTDLPMTNCASAPACAASGEEDTVFLTRLDSDAALTGTQSHPMADHCDALNLHGQTDWYLPSYGELDVMYTNRVAIGGFDTSLQYPSSSENSNGNLWEKSFATGAASTDGKDFLWQVRCARRDVDIEPSGLSLTDQTGLAAAALTSSNIVQLTGLGAAARVSLTTSGRLAAGYSGYADPEYRVCSDATCTSVVVNWTSTSGSTISNNQYLQVRAYAAEEASATKNIIVIAGTGIDTWSLTAAAADPCSGSPNPGAVCSDGSVYAGLTPDGSVAMYVPRCDAGQTWGSGVCGGTATGSAYNDGNTSWTDTGVTNCVTWASCGASGETDTGTLIAADSNAGAGGTQIHDAANYCDTLNLHGQTDWYLPSIRELDVMQSNELQIGSFSRSALTSYWTTSEYDGDSAWEGTFPSGGTKSVSNAGKSDSQRVRCVRK